MFKVRAEFAKNQEIPFYLPPIPSSNGHSPSIKLDTKGCVSENSGKLTHPRSMLTETELPKPLEFKAKISKTDFTKAHHKLLLGKYHGRFEQEDYYLENPKVPFARVEDHGTLDTREYLRIRSSPAYDTLEYKHIYEENGTKQAEEYEISVEDPQTLLKLFQKLGYTHTSTLKKIREAFTFQGFNVSLDHFIDHGYFIEVGFEQLTLHDIHSDIDTFLREDLGITHYHVEDRSYRDLFTNL